MLLGLTPQATTCRSFGARVEPAFLTNFRLHVFPEEPNVQTLNIPTFNAYGTVTTIQSHEARRVG